MNRKLSGESVPCTGRCLNASYQLAEGRGKIDARYLMGVFEDPAKGIGRSIILDLMVFDTTAREAWISPGPSYGRSWEENRPILREPRELILDYSRAQELLSSGVVEGLNNKAKVSMRKSYGFRTFRVLELALCHSLGNLPETESTHDFF